MKVLIASNYKAPNTYVKNIADELSKFCHIITDLSSFWCSEHDFDIVHIQWPEELFQGKRVTDNDLQLLRKRILYWKTKGAKTVATRHNELPHRKDPLDKELYNIVYGLTDGVIHLGSDSRKRLSSQECELSVVISHPDYFDLFNELDKSKARKLLGLSDNGNMFISVGRLRNQNEEHFLVEGFLKHKKKNPNDFLVLCNSKSPLDIPSFRKEPFKRVVWESKHIYKTFLMKRRGVIYSENHLSLERLNTYLNASDVVVSPRLDSLNSGIIFLGFTYGKPVVGPNIGNIREVLELSSNPMFSPSDLVHFVSALAIAAENKVALGRSNIKFVKENCNTQEIAFKHFEFYKQVLARKK